MAFKSKVGKGEGTSDPEHKFVEQLHDEQYNAHWLRLEWEGDEYEDCWLLAQMPRSVIDLEENR